MTGISREVTRYSNRTFVYRKGFIKRCDPRKPVPWLDATYGIPATLYHFSDIMRAINIQTDERYTFEYRNGYRQVFITDKRGTNTMTLRAVEFACCCQFFVYE